jgi:poly-gamma-glutamate capsule biosynthesis protein CapA/YwtB (metallophosphatase superfamily)
MRWWRALGLGVAAAVLLVGAWTLPAAGDTQGTSHVTGTSHATDTTPAAGMSHVTIAWVGDMALQGLAPSSLFSGVRRQLSSADIAIGNLEGTLSVGGTSKCGKHSTDCYAFQSPPRSAPLFQAAGFDDLNVANNHAFDYGSSGQTQTLRALASHKLRWSGRPKQIRILRSNGISVAILGFAPYPWAQSLTDIPAAEKLVQKAKARADLVICVLHAGAEGADHQHVPQGTEYYLGENRGNARLFAHSVIAAGADLVVASGPHVLRGMQRYHGKVIAYSLGNFATAGGALSTGGVLGQSGIFKITLRSDGTATSGKFLPVQLVNGAPRLVHGASNIVSRVNALSRSDFGSGALLVSPKNALRLH